MVKKKSLALSEVYRLLEPGPVVMVTTADNDKMNVMTMSWHMMMDFMPPIVGALIGEQSYTFHILKKTKECVINIPTVELAKKVVQVGNSSGRKVNKFEKFHLAQESGSQVHAPLLTECYANLECKVIDMNMVTPYNLFILEVKKAWIRPTKTKVRTIHHCGKGIFIVDGNRLQILSKKK